VMKTCEWYRDTLGFRFMGYTVLDHDPNTAVFGVLTMNEKSHDLGFGGDFSKVPGRFHHVAFWVPSYEDLLRAADLLLESGTAIEFGPGKHGIGEQGYLYFRDPVGLRVELNTGGYRNYIPDWQPTVWRPSQGSHVMFRNLEYGPKSFMEAMPPAPEPAIAEPDVAPVAAGAANRGGQRG
ncbi:MAG TPA: VOC family protein, partial [Candidatus Acidoferrales bacterium]